jgi:hypothetical protein
VHGKEQERLSCETSRLFDLALASLAWLGCAGDIAELPVRSKEVCVSCQHPACETPLFLTYLGSGGLLMRRGGDEIATGPFFSNFGFLKTGLSRITADEDAIRRYMPERPDVPAILVGHAHYDHLIDVPLVVKHKTPKAIVYASESARNMLASLEPPLPIVAVDDRAWSPGEPEQWIRIPETNVFVLPITSEHAPHLCGIKLMQGSHGEPLDEVPKRSTGWLEGQTHAFLIEFRDAEGRPEFRIHYQDSATNSGVGYPPPHDASTPRPYTILIPTVASHGQVTGYPEGLVGRLAPDYAVLAHWEDFFRPFTSDPAQLKSVRLTDPVPFLERMSVALGPKRFTLPAPLTEVRFSQSCP